ncbi:MAG: hypothetical protein ACXQTR_02480 [Candidatus Methanospirareceae archaeon]
MLEHLIFSELWTKLDANKNNIFNYSPTPAVAIYRSEQIIEDFAYPALFIGFLDPVVDRRNTPLNEIFSIKLIDEEGNDTSGSDPSANIDYTKGVVVQQSIDLLLYDNDIKRIAQLQNQLFLWLKQHLTLTGVTIFDILPPLNLDFTEEDYVYKRNIEVICKYRMSWEEIITTIENVDYELTISEE